MNDRPVSEPGFGPPDGSAASAAEPAGRARALARVARAARTVIVLAGIALLAWHGHQTGWTIPRLSGIAGRDMHASDDWCEVHGVPESQCVECQPGLMSPQRDYGWCTKHRVPDCPWEHPDVAQLEGPRTVSMRDRERAERALALAERPGNRPECKLQARRIQLVSPEAAQAAGIEVEPVRRGPMTEAVTANGEASYDQTRVVRLSTRFSGTVWRVLKGLGARVAAGDVLALIDSPEVGRSKAELLQAMVLLEVRTRTLDGLRAADGAVPERQLKEAEAALREAQIRLGTAEQALVNLGLPVRTGELRAFSPEEMTRRMQFLGLPETLVCTFDHRTTTANLLPVRTPLDGEVVAQAAVAGEAVDSARELFMVADTGRMWVTLNLAPEEIKKVRPRQAVRFRPSVSDDEFAGTLTWISTAVDEKTRTVPVRAELSNPDGRLLAHTFGTGRVILRHEEQTIVVPSEAVHWEGCCHVVFVRDRDFLKDGAPKVFHPRKVQVGTRDDQQTEILAGVVPGELVATKGSGTLRAELLKNRMGEG